MKTIRTRIQELEHKANVSGGQLYWIMNPEKDVYILKDGDDEIVMNEEEFGKWERSKNENDFVYIVSKYEGN